MKEAFTLIEILLVVSIFAILVAFTAPLGIDFYGNQQMDSDSAALVSALRSAQLKAMSAENDSSFGVYLTNSGYTLFKGNSYASRDGRYDEIREFSPSNALSGLQEIIFSKLTGVPNATGTIILVNESASSTIDINEVGRINLL